MNPVELARQAVRVTDRLEAEQLKRVLAFLRVIQDDATGLVRTLGEHDMSKARVIRELRAKQALEGSILQTRLLSMGSASGPLADGFRVATQAAYEDGLKTARAAAVATGTVTGSTAASVTVFGALVDIEFLAALTSTTLTTLKRVGEDALRRIERELVRGAARGDGPRRTARRVRQAVDLTRYESERIVRTVFNRANNEARDRMFDALDVEYLQASAVNDERVCEYCAARHGMVWKRRDAPRYPIHPNDRCTLIPWNPDTPPDRRGDAYYERTRAEYRDSGAKTTTATAAAPFEKADGIEPSAPVWAPGRGWL